MHIKIHAGTQRHANKEQHTPKHACTNAHTWQTAYTDLVILWHHCQCWIHVNRLLWLAEPGCLTEATKTMGISIDTFHILRQLARDDSVKAAASESDPSLPFSDIAVWWRSEPSWLIVSRRYAEQRAPSSSGTASHNDLRQTFSDKSAAVKHIKN